jgi:hypothetical protein
MNKKKTKNFVQQASIRLWKKNENEDWKVERDKVNVKNLNEQGKEKCITPNHDNVLLGTWDTMVVLLQDVAYL